MITSNNFVVEVEIAGQKFRSVTPMFEADAKLLCGSCEEECVSDVQPKVVYERWKRSLELG